MTEEQLREMILLVKRRFPQMEHLSDELVTDIINEAEAEILGYTRRDMLMLPMLTYVSMLAIHKITNLGTELQSEIPANIRKLCTPYRRAVFRNL